MRTSATMGGRNLRLLVIGLLAALLLPVTAALVAPGTAYAVDAGGGGEATTAPEEGGAEPLPGPEPNPTSTFAPADYTRPWTWWLSVILTAVTVIAVGGLGLGYFVLVGRNREEE